MVSGVLITIIVLVTISVSVSYFLLSAEEIPAVERPTFVDFLLRQEGANILIQNVGINNISAGSLRIYFGNSLTQVTNKNDISPGSTYTIKTSELPSFEGKMNITVAFGNVNKSIEIQSIVEVTRSISEIYPSLPPRQPPSSPEVKFYSLGISAIGGGTINLVPTGGEYEEGTEVEANAVPDVNHTFGYYMWDNNTITYENSTIVRMDRNRSLTSVFLIRSDVDCVRSNPGVTIANSTPQSNTSMTFLITATNRDYKCGLESFELTPSCQSTFTCTLQERLITIGSGNSSATTGLVMSPKNITAMSTGNYTFYITVKNRGNTGYGSANSSFYEIK